MALNKLNQIQNVALKAIEWSGNRDDCKGPFCPSCSKYQSENHAERCLVGGAIASFADVVRVEELIT